MIVPDRNDRIVEPEHTRDYSFLLLGGAFTVIATIIAGAGFYLYSGGVTSVRTAQAYEAVLGSFGISMPASYRPSTAALRYLDQLHREPCDRAAIKPLAAIFESEGYARESAKALEIFTIRCSSSAELLEPAFLAYERLSDHKAAIRVATELMRLDPAYTRWPYLRGLAYERMKDYQHALNDYVTALELFQNTSNVVANEFYRISRMFDALGRPCEAITPIETFIGFDPAKRRTNQLVNLIKNFAAKGGCQHTYANGADRILMQDGSNIVDVAINGTKGRFLVDTGASFVSITKDFAQRANVAYSATNVVQTKTAGGTLAMALGKATQVSVGKADAADVTVAVAPEQQHAFGERLDGLLGMSFLSRFDVTVAASYLELRRRKLTE